MKDQIAYLTILIDLIGSPEIARRLDTIGSHLEKLSKPKKLSVLVEHILHEHTVREDIEMAARDMLCRELERYIKALREGELIFQLMTSLKPSSDRNLLLADLHRLLNGWENDYKTKIGQAMSIIVQDMLVTFETHEKLKETESSLVRHKTVAQERTENLQRLKADFENFKKRISKEKEQIGETANEELLQSLLPVLDSFDNALKHVPPEDERDEAWKGLVMIHQLLLQALGAREVRPIEAEGQPFNPDLHEAMMSEPVNDLEQETVLQDMRRGYTYRGKLLRPSMVKVGVPAEGEAT